MRDSTASQSVRLDRLASLLEGTFSREGSPEAWQGEFISGELPEAVPCVKLASWKRFSLMFLPGSDSFAVQVRGELPVEVSPLHIDIWQTCLLGCCIAAVLRGNSILPVHGALLDTPRGGVLLCGQSGMGKTTTSRRWQAAGGRVPADDMVLLEYGDDGLFVHPMPTWTHCRETLEGACFPFGNVIPLTRVIALGRGKGRETLERISEREFYMSVYSACCLFSSQIIKRLPAASQKTLLGAIQRTTTLLCGLSEPSALLACLDADIRTTLKDYL